MIIIKNKEISDIYLIINNFINLIEKNKLNYNEEFIIEIEKNIIKNKKEYFILNLLEHIALYSNDDKTKQEYNVLTNYFLDKLEKNIFNIKDFLPHNFSIDNMNKTIIEINNYPFIREDFVNFILEIYSNNKYNKEENFTDLFYEIFDNFLKYEENNFNVHIYRLYIDNLKKYKNNNKNILINIKENHKKIENKIIVNKLVSYISCFGTLNRLETILKNQVKKINQENRLETTPKNLVKETIECLLQKDYNFNFYIDFDLFTFLNKEQINFLKNINDLLKFCEKNIEGKELKNIFKNIQDKFNKNIKETLKLPYRSSINTQFSIENQEKQIQSFIFFINEIQDIFNKYEEKYDKKTMINDCLIIIKENHKIENLSIIIDKFIINNNIDNKNILNNASKKNKI